MNKQGISYVDWTISFGLFLITVIFLFMLIRPTLDKGYEKEEVLTLAQERFFDEVGWSVKKLPLIINKFQPVYHNGQETKDTLIQVFSSSDYSVEYTLPSEFEELSQNPLKFKCGAGKTCNPTSFDMVVSPLNTKEDAPPELILECIPNNPAICDALLGATETYTGIQKKAVDTFRALSYEQQKVRVNLPSGLEVAYFVDNDQLTHNTQAPRQQTNVFVREVHTWIVQEDGSAIPAVVRIQVWS